MAGITHGLLTGVLVTSGLSYLTATQFNSNAIKIKNEINSCIETIEKRNDPIPHISNVRSFYSSSISEGAKDLWNEEVISAVNWWYNLKIGNQLTNLITDVFK
ncbi:hypothetical protein C6P40_003802 [Pichia californica]|uniref:MICOS complex subunit MIC12 n=1 Tax=Pichia californica TaxID=460514 RepID=A0A9P7BEN5_9ASCO|nr:hypothetical protein C6P42_000412 [[Candida] californica]KAG0686553.1 hypothetical protein C6P40_003802 [[Candida] californica]